MTANTVSTLGPDFKDSYSKKFKKLKKLIKK